MSQMPDAIQSTFAVDISRTLCTRTKLVGLINLPVEKLVSANILSDTFLSRNFIQYRLPMRLSDFKI